MGGLVENEFIEKSSEKKLKQRFLVSITVRQKPPTSAEGRDKSNKTWVWLRMSLLGLGFGWERVYWKEEKEKN